MANENYVLTQEGKEKLEEELHYLETEKRAEIGERIKVAREFGDISENSEYDDAKNEQGMMEARIAEIFRERLSSPMMVVSLGTVRLAMEQLGQPDDFGECRSGDGGGFTPCTGESTSEPAPRKLYRSRSDRAIAGVCGGLADYLRVAPLAIRLRKRTLLLSSEIGRAHV